MKLFSFTGLLGLVGLAKTAALCGGTGESRADVPAGAITIGSGGKYSTISAALKDTSSNIYYIYSGTYKEQVYINRANVKSMIFYGQTASKLNYNSNTVTITNSLSAAAAGSNDLSGTVRVAAAGVSLYNLNIANTYGKGAQAIALSVQAGTFGAYACKLTGYQDTLLANKGTQFYGRSYINGATDFVMHPPPWKWFSAQCVVYLVGTEASIWITKSTIETVASGYITASGRNSGDANYYVIDNSTIKGTGSCYLGRPWREYARVIFQNSNIGSNIVAAGWKNWNDNTPNTAHVYYGEYNNSGAGAWNSKRVSFATKMTSPIAISTVLGSTSWVDSAYL
ncbi:Pectinesterase [Rhizoctonia solani]|uniref:pectinesterase n=1 Tax=Rhizoctonia solani TaxID=456999 RepID=A0A8H7H491_9AGAM|nr:Pectinesterase [Rhizoctonia solani]